VSDFVAIARTLANGYYPNNDDSPKEALIPMEGVIAVAAILACGACMLMMVAMGAGAVRKFVRRGNGN
jgi:hypothetical protein